MGPPSDNDLSSKMGSRFRAAFLVRDMCGVDGDHIGEGDQRSLWDSVGISEYKRV